MFFVWANLLLLLSNSISLDYKNRNIFTLEGEKWKSLPKSEYYYISNFGRAKSTKNKRILILKQSIDTAGYLRVGMNHKSVTKAEKIHLMVLSAFVKKPFENAQVNHIDGDKLNNNLSNLEWLTAKQNMKHAYSKGLLGSLKGFDSPKCRLSKKEILAIFNSKKTQKETAVKFDISHHHAWGIKNGIYWSEVTGKKYIGKGKYKTAV